MALILHHSISSSSPSSFISNKPSQIHLKPTNLSIKSQQQDQETPSSNKPTGFGSSATTTAAKKNNNKPSKGKRERASIIRREPFEKPSFEPTPEQAARAEELRKSESAFQLVWLGLGGVILFQGIALAASGFLPEEWDRLFVKYLYPLFTPTVFLFVAGTVAYGVLKYLQNEEMNKPN